MSENKAGASSILELSGTVDKHGGAPYPTVVGSNTGTTAPNYGHGGSNIDEEDMPLAELRRLRLLHAAEEANASGGVANGGTTHGVAERASMMLRAHHAIASAIDRTHMQSASATVASGEVRSLNMPRPGPMEIALQRARMVTSHWLEISPSETTANTDSVLPGRTFTRSRALTDPVHGSWRGYRQARDTTWAQARPNPPVRPHIDAGFWDYLAEDLDRMIENGGTLPVNANAGAGGHAA